MLRFLKCRRGRKGWRITLKERLEKSSQLAILLSMPIYEFHCGQCEKDSEVLVRSSNWEGTKCPHCGSKKLQKKFSVFASATAGATTPDASCSGNPRSCGMCGTGKPHSH